MIPTNTAQRYDVSVTAPRNSEVFCSVQLLGPDFDYPLLTISIGVGRLDCGCVHVERYFCQSSRQSLLQRGWPRVRLWRTDGNKESTLF